MPIERPVNLRDSARRWILQDAAGRFIADCGGGDRAKEWAEEMRDCLNRAEAVPDDLLRAALWVMAWSAPWHIAHALRYPESIGRPYDELYAAGVEIQERARKALAAMGAVSPDAEKTTGKGA